MELVWFEDFLALAETLNFSRAAEARHVTQPAFSRRIRSLEGWIGADLFTRTTHGVALTPAGVHFRGQAEILTRSLHQLRRDTLEVSGRARALSIAATHALSFTFFPKWVRNHDKVLALGNLNLISDSMEACEQMMLRGDVQLLLCHFHRALSGRLATSQFESVVVGTDTLVPLCAPGSKGGAARWRLRSGKPVRHLAYSSQSGLGRIVAAFPEMRKTAVRLETIFTSHLAATLQSMARAGDGVAWLPRTLAEEDIAAGSLVEAGDAIFHIPIEVRLFRPVARQSPAAEAAWAAFCGTGQSG